MIDTILWDNDGILVDTEGTYYQATREVMGDLGYDLTPEVYVEYFLLQGNGAWHLLSDDPVQMRAWRDIRNGRFSELLSGGVVVIDGVGDVLEALSGRFQMGVCTASRRDHFEIIHRETGLLRYFDFVVTAEDVQETKPAPDLYLLGLDRAERSANECVVVEDSARGLLAAHAAGVPCYVIPTDWTASSDFGLAAGVLDSAGELVKVLGAE